MEDTATRSKIGTLPHEIREELNRRLLDGQGGPIILPWLNGLPRVRAILDGQHGGVDVSDNNLSNWRTGPYRAWLARHRQLERTEIRAKHSAALVEMGGGTLSAGAAAIVGGQVTEILELLEDLDERPEDPKEFAAWLELKAKALAPLVAAVVSLRHADLSREDKQLKREALAERRRETDLKERTFQLKFVEGFEKWFDNAEARKIMASKEDKPVRMDKLMQLMFGDRPKLEGEE